MRAAGVPCAELWIPHPSIGCVPNLRLPIRLYGTPIADPVASPGVGQHTREVLSGTLGYAEDRIDRLAEAGALGAPAQRDD